MGFGVGCTRKVEPQHGCAGVDTNIPIVLEYLLAAGDSGRFDWGGAPKAGRVG